MSDVLDFDLNPTADRMRAKTILVEALKMCAEENITTQDALSGLLDITVAMLAQGVRDAHESEYDRNNAIDTIAEELGKGIKTFTNTGEDDE